VDKFKAVIAFARAAFSAEFLSPPGILNALWMFTAFVLVSAFGIIDGYQALVRTVKEDYESGMPSFIWMLLTYGGLSFVCIVIVGLFTRPRQ
jgi:hypothetical protein